MDVHADRPSRLPVRSHARAPVGGGIALTPTRSARAFVVVLALSLVGSACGRRSEDEAKLRRTLATSERGARSFVYTEAARDRWFQVRGVLADDLRYRLTISSPRGVVVEAIVDDDALAVRLPHPALFAGVTVPLGDPATDALLRAGRWVTDPAGAPPLSPPRPDQALREAPDPLEVGVGMLRGVRDGIGGSRGVKRFNLEDIEYKPSEDPWRQPARVQGEERYDLIRPVLPKREEEMQQGQGRISEAQFRKTSVFVRQGKVEQVCQMVDVEGHEEFKRMRERGIRNAFLESILKQVQKGKTDLPVRPRTVLFTVSYPKGATVRIPKAAARARLNGFLSGLHEAFKQSLIAPPGPIPGACLHPLDAKHGGSAAGGTARP